MTNFLAELNLGEHKIQPTPSNEYDKSFNVYEVDIRTPPRDSYWLDWGGCYDNFVGTQISVYYGRFLERARSLNELLTRPDEVPMPICKQFIRDDGVVLINIPKHPWLYADYSHSAEQVLPFISNALNPDDPSNNTIRGAMAPVKLNIPSFTTKLSENINGITLKQGFSVSLKNDDGYFDDSEKWNLFNKPVHLKKTVVENPQYEDFRLIRAGLADSTATTFDGLNVEVGDLYRSMTEPVCNIIAENSFMDLQQNINEDFRVTEQNAIGRNIPIVYGSRQIKATRIRQPTADFPFNVYVVAEFVGSLLACFDRDGNRILNFARRNNMIWSPYEIDSVSMTGYANNTISGIIRHIIENKTNIQFLDSSVNLGEFDGYPAIQVGVVIDSGLVRDAIAQALKSDMAYFIQQNDGRFTLRRYGTEYNTHRISAYMITKKPEKENGDAQQNYFSSCIVNFNTLASPAFVDTDAGFIFEERANEAERMYKRRIQRIFDTDLTNRNLARNLALLLSDRFTKIKNTIKIAVGIDTSGFELLDYVELDLNINDRRFNGPKKYFIKELNPAQDIIVLEEL